jgi:hypothetical protein
MVRGYPSITGVRLCMYSQPNRNFIARNSTFSMSSGLKNLSRMRIYFMGVFLPGEGQKNFRNSARRIGMSISITARMLRLIYRLALTLL